jgi:hypothetical protein
METGSSSHHSPVGSFQLTGYLVPHRVPRLPCWGESAQSALDTIATGALSLVSCLTRRSGSQNDVLAASRPFGRRAAARRVGILLADVSESGRTPGRKSRLASIATAARGSHDAQPGTAGRRGGNRAFRLPPAAGVAALLPWWGVLQTRVVQLRHRQGVGAGWRQPSRAPRQGLPAVTVMACWVWGGAALHRPLTPPQPLQLCRQRPGTVLQILQVAVAVERPAVDGARPAAPIAGARGAGTGVVGFGPAAAFVALVEPGSGRDADLPGPTRRPAGHQVSPPLAWLPDSDQPTKPAGTAKPEPHGTRPPYSPAGGPAGHGLVRRPEGAT